MCTLFTILLTILSSLCETPGNGKEALSLNMAQFLGRFGWILPRQADRLYSFAGLLMMAATYCSEGTRVAGSPDKVTPTSLYHFPDLLHPPEVAWREKTGFHVVNVFFFPLKAYKCFMGAIYLEKQHGKKKKVSSCPSQHYFPTYGCFKV